jgi:ubiquinone/menaquinone biosynthesis C-methylase UbiE
MSLQVNSVLPGHAAQDYYANGPELTGRVLDALRAGGRDVDTVDPDDLAALDEFHGLGRAATLTMAELAGVTRGEHVLDVGAGIGGPARTLAGVFGAHVTALEPTRRFCELNADLCRRTGLAEQIDVVSGDARRMPLADGRFDVVWTQAVWPSIDDKKAMLDEMHRVLATGGRLAVYELVSGPAGGELQYPVPWADAETQSFLVSAQQVQDLAEAAAFTRREWLAGKDLIAHIAEVARSGRPGMAAGVDGVTLALVMPDFQQRMASLARNVEEQRIEMVMAVFEKR